MIISEQFATAPTSIDELPEPFRQGLQNRMGAGDKIRLVIFAPAFQTGPLSAYASVLAITYSGWIVLQEGEDKALSVTGCPFGDTLLIELGILLLHGHLKIDFISEGAPDSVVVEFNAVKQELFAHAVQLILEGMESRSDPRPGQEDLSRELGDWPLKLRNASVDYLPRGCHLYEAIYWETVRDGFKRELAPAGALFVTGREIVLVTDEKARFLAKDSAISKLGDVVTYLPLKHLSGFHVYPHHRFGILSIEVKVLDGLERLDVVIPVDELRDVQELMTAALKRSRPSGP